MKRASGKRPVTWIWRPGAAKNGVVQYAALVSGSATLTESGVVSNHQLQNGNRVGVAAGPVLAHRRPSTPVSVNAAVVRSAGRMPSLLSLRRPGSAAARGFGVWAAGRARGRTRRLRY